MNLIAQKCSGNNKSVSQCPQGILMLGQNAIGQIETILKDVLTLLVEHLRLAVPGERQLATVTLQYHLLGALRSSGAIATVTIAVLIEDNALRGPACKTDSDVRQHVIVHLLPIVVQGTTGHHAASAAPGLDRSEPDTLLVLAQLMHHYGVASLMDRHSPHVDRVLGYAFGFAKPLPKHGVGQMVEGDDAGFLIYILSERNQQCLIHDVLDLGASTLVVVAGSPFHLAFL